MAQISALDAACVSAIENAVALHLPVHETNAWAHDLDLNDCYGEATELILCGSENLFVHQFSIRFDGFPEANVSSWLLPLVKRPRSLTSSKSREPFSSPVPPLSLEN